MFIPIISLINRYLYPHSRSFIDVYTHTLIHSPMFMLTLSFIHSFLFTSRACALLPTLSFIHPCSGSYPHSFTDGSGRVLIYSSMLKITHTHTNKQTHTHFS